MLSLSQKGANANHKQIIYKVFPLFTLINLGKASDRLYVVFSTIYLYFQGN